MSTEYRLGVIGGGQLARMLATAAEPLNVKVIAIEKTADCPAAINSDIIVADYTDQKALQQLADQTDAITFEFENVDVAAIKAANIATFPHVDALATTQDRILEKTFLQANHIPVGEFRAVDLTLSLDHSVPFNQGVLKTTRFGYDGKGQYRFQSQGEFQQLIKDIQPAQFIAEQWIAFDYEVSIIAARNIAGDTVFYPLTKNVHKDGILHQSTAPLDNSDLQQQAQQTAATILQAFNYVGVLAIEFFVVGEQLLVNEMAPRVHNSGHWTIEGAVTSQFANHVRAVLGMPLGSTAMIAPVEMTNCIGNMPERDEVLKEANAYLHDYGKAPREGRKLGHITRLFSQLL